MTIRIGWGPLVVAAAVGLAALSAVRSGWFNYVWEKLKYGETVHVSGRCYELPSDWTVVPGGRVGVSDLRRHFAGEGPEAMASVLPAQMVAGLQSMGAASAPMGSGFVLYDLGPSSPGGVRYIAQSDATGIALMGSRDELVRELAVGLATCR
jgi:hypothetical protein